MDRLRSPLLACILAGCFLATARGQSSHSDNDEQTLRHAGISTDGPALLAAVRKHTLTAETRTKLDRLIVRLGDESFAQREKATRELFAVGRLALPRLRKARKHKDLEIAHRAQQLIERIEQAPLQPLPLAVLRLLAAGKPAGSVETLLAYLPHAEEESRMEDVRQTLTLLAQRDGNADPALVRALAAGSLLQRETAIRALVEGGGAEGRSAVRKLLAAKKPLARMHAALALAWAKEREAIPVLIDLLAVLPEQHISPVEETLYRLAEDSAPQTPAGAGPSEREKYRAAWAVWWKINAAHADLNRLDGQRALGFTLICDNEKNRVYEIDRRGKIRWIIGNISNPLDAWVLPGNRVLIAESNAHRVSERDFKGRILWETAIRDPVSVQRLPNGNTFLATYKGRILEVDRAGKTIYTISQVRGSIMAAYRMSDGVIVYQTSKGECCFVDTTGKLLKCFGIEQNAQYANAIDLAPGGRILVALDQRGKVMEFDREGKKLLELSAPGVTTATRLPNGHILATSKTTRRIYELDRGGKIVWEHTTLNRVFRARRR